MSKYPSNIDDNISLPVATNAVVPPTANSFNKLREAVINIEKELGVNPKQDYGNVSARLDELEDDVSLLNTTSISLSQDLGGTTSQPKVIGLQGKPLSSDNPVVNKVVMWDGIIWKPSYVTCGGDISGNAISATVTGIRNKNVASTTPVQDNLLTFDVGQWVPKKNKISIFNPVDCFVVELQNSLFDLGQLVNPTLLMNYNETPSSVTVQNNAIPVQPTETVTIGPSWTASNTYTSSTYGDSVTLDVYYVYGLVTNLTTLYVKFVNRVYWGTGLPGGNSSGFVTSLPNSVLAESKTMSFVENVSTGNSLYFAHRADYGYANLSINGIPGGFKVVNNSLPITNINGVIENYILYETDTLSLGSCNINVT